MNSQDQDITLSKRHVYVHDILYLGFVCTSTDEDDYTALTRAVTLTPTVTQQCVSVMIEDDSVLEETESLTVSLSLTGAPDSVHLFQQTATIVITDNDSNGADIYMCIRRYMSLFSLYT